MKVRLTIEYLNTFPDGASVPPIVLEFDEFTIEQSRTVHREYDAEGQVSKLVPGPTMVTTIVGSKTESSDSQGCRGCDGCQCAP